MNIWKSLVLKTSLPQKQIAQQAGISQSLLSQVINEKTKPSTKFIRKISKVIPEASKIITHCNNCGEPLQKILNQNEKGK